MVRRALRISNSTDFELSTNIFILSDFTILCTFHQTHFTGRDTVPSSSNTYKILKIKYLPRRSFTNYVCMYIIITNIL